VVCFRDVRGGCSDGRGGARDRRDNRNVSLVDIDTVYKLSWLR